MSEIFWHYLGGRNSPKNENKRLFFKCKNGVIWETLLLHWMITDKSSQMFHHFPE